MSPSPEIGLVRPEQTTTGDQQQGRVLRPNQPRQAPGSQPVATRSPEDAVGRCDVQVVDMCYCQRPMGYCMLLRTPGHQQSAGQGYQTTSSFSQNSWDVGVRTSGQQREKHGDNMPFRCTLRSSLTGQGALVSRRRQERTYLGNSHVGLQGCHSQVRIGSRRCAFVAGHMESFKCQAQYEKGER